MRAVLHFTFLFLSLLSYCDAFSPSFISSSTRSIHRNVPFQSKQILQAKSEEELEEEEVQKEVRAKLKGLLNEEGVPYAPWLMRQVDIESTERMIRNRRRRERENLALKDGSAAILTDAQGQEFAKSLRYRILDDSSVELGWLTSEETADNVGFIVQRRTEFEEEFTDIASYETYPPLNSKGTEGGFYTYIDQDVEPGIYSYRVVDINEKGQRSALCQAGVDVISSGDKLKTKVAVGAFIAFATGAVIATTVFGPSAQLN